MTHNDHYEEIKGKLLPYLSSYDVTYRYYPEGDFGALNQMK
jgi:hypothetical protein